MLVGAVIHHYIYYLKKLNHYQIFRFLKDFTEIMSSHDIQIVNLICQK